MKLTLSRIFRFIAILEGISYILLLIATPIKYILKNEQYVQALGMPHGILFILYVGLAVFVQKKMSWNNKTLVVVIIASVIPFGAFYIDYKYLK
tara:strand:- start:4 stop:285 length:282 start_codon:yes stop_codon:yes gene_type:complete